MAVVGGHGTAAACGTCPTHPRRVVALHPCVLCSSVEKLHGEQPVARWEGRTTTCHRRHAMVHRHGVADSSRLPRPIRRSLMPMVMTCTAALFRQRRSSGTLSLPKCCWGCAVWRTRRASALHGGAGAGAVPYLNCSHGVSRRLPIW